MFRQCVALRVEVSSGRRVMLRHGMGGMVWQARFVTASYGSVGYGSAGTSRFGKAARVRARRRRAGVVGCVSDRTGAAG